MPIQSMTGFARNDGHFPGFRWVWELRSVNGKGLDVRLRIPPGCEDIEESVRRSVSASLKRGNIQTTLQVIEEHASAVPRINDSVVFELSKAAEKLQKKIGGELPSIADYMMMKGVVEYDVSDLSDTDRKGRNASLLESFQLALKELAASRTEEGQAIRTIVLEQVKKIESLRHAIEHNDSRSENAIRARLEQQIKRLLDGSDLSDEQRIYQEAVILAAKADLQEELDRLAVHVATAQELLDGEGPVGRKLDFLAQEFNRECNTICSKSNAAEVTTLGLDMKIVIDQFREQVQNLE